MACKLQFVSSCYSVRSCCLEFLLHGTPEGSTVDRFLITGKENGREFTILNTSPTLTEYHSLFGKELRQQPATFSPTVWMDLPSIPPPPTSICHAPQRSCSWTPEAAERSRFPGDCLRQTVHRGRCAQQLFFLRGARRRHRKKTKKHPSALLKE